MSIHAWMLAGMLFGAMPPLPAENAPTPRFEKGQEITWRGTFSEAILRPNVRAFRTYEVETRLYVLDVFKQNADVALFTSVKLKPDVPTTPLPSAVVRLELARIDPMGKAQHLPIDSLYSSHEKRKPTALPLMGLEGLPTFETGAFVGLPGEKIRFGDAWELTEEKRPPLRYRLEGADSVRGSRCLKISMIQQTDDWDKSRTDTAAWRRSEICWISAKHGTASRFERTIEKRDPQTGEVGFRSKLAYEQVANMRYPDRFGEDRREEIAGTAQFIAEFERLLPEAGRTGARPFEELRERIDGHVSSHFSGEAVPYRQALMSLKRKVEAASRGHIAPASPPVETANDSGPLTVGKRILDVTAIDLANGEAVTLSKLRGRPIMLVYYQPSSARTAEPLMRFADALSVRHAGKAIIMPLGVGDAQNVARQRTDWKLSVHVFSGRDVYKKHGVESTPCFVIVDSAGIVRNVTLGWSEENAIAVADELDKWVR